MIGVVSRARAVVTAGLLLSVLAVGGCSDDDPEPRFGPTPSVTSAASDSASPEETDDPNRAFAAWIDARNQAMRTGDVAPVLALSTSDCRSCRNSVEPLAAVYEDGGQFRTVGWRVVSSTVESRSSRRARLSAAVKYAAGTTVPSRGADPVSYQAEHHIMQVDLVKTDGRWLVDFLGYLS